ncbi:MAG: AGE family epimerase/isomerase [Verrucomicrobiae bacterium]|nr:AGE family epimerase/isomerase [Verrucomicrobiae bacterium]
MKTSAVRALLPWAAKFREELDGNVIPFWLKHALDRECGGYFTCLDRDGSVYDDRKYLWLQGRFTWMFARLWNQWEKKAAYLDAAKLGADFLREKPFDDRGRVWFSLDREGRPMFFQRKVYAGVFVCMGLLEYSVASGDASCRRLAEDLFQRVLAWLDDPSLIDRPPLPGQIPMSNLANAMVRAGLAIEFAAVDSDPRHLAVLRDCIPGILRHYDPTLRVFRENVARDGRRLSALPEGRLFNPGHSIETAWFLLHLLERHPDAAARQIALDAIEGSLELGWDRAHGGLFYFMDLEGKPVFQIEHAMKLWWPHTEAIYALVLALLEEGEGRWRGWFEKVMDYTWARFPDREYGHWFGYLDREGRVSSACKGNHYKGFFHTPRALMMCVQRIEAAARAS